MGEFTKVGQRAYVYRAVREILKNFAWATGISWLLGGITFIAMKHYNYFALLFSLVYILMLLWDALVIYLESRVLGYRLEPNSILYRDGVFSVEKLAIPYARITNASYTQSLFQRFFSVGDVIIDQEDSSSVLEGLDGESAHKILTEISKRSNVQPIYGASEKAN